MRVEQAQSCPQQSDIPLLPEVGAEELQIGIASNHESACVEHDQLLRLSDSRSATLFAFVDRDVAAIIFEKVDALSIDNSIRERVVDRSSHRLAWIIKLTRLTPPDSFSRDEEIESCQSGFWQKLWQLLRSAQPQVWATTGRAGWDQIEMATGMKQVSSTLSPPTK